MNVDFSKIQAQGVAVIPAIVQDARTQQVLMLGFMNQEALEKTQETKKVWFYSRSKQRLWMKGETSGNTLNVQNLFLDCDNDTLLIKVNPQGPTCHKGTVSCFAEEPQDFVIEELFQLIEQRFRDMPENSYTTHLFNKGLEKICAKVEEESLEVIKAATQETQQRVIEESVDVLYHLFVLLVQQKVSIDQIKQEMTLRRK